MIRLLIIRDSFEPEAESKCEEYLSQAQQVDPENPEVYQLLASVRLSQQRNEEASSQDLVKIYPPGMKIWIVSDGHVFSDCIGVDDDVVSTY